MNLGAVIGAAKSMRLRIERGRSNFKETSIMNGDFVLVVGGLCAVFLTLCGSIAWGIHQTNQLHHRHW
jgi:hypothetical protein